MPAFIPTSFTAQDPGGYPVNDSFGSLTQIADTAIVRVGRNRSGQRLRMTAFAYLAAGTAHNMYVLTPADEVTLTTDAAISQAVINVSRLPVNADASALANTDYILVEDEHGLVTPYLFSSNSGLAITLTSNITTKSVKGKRVWLMGTPSDFATARKFILTASTLVEHRSDYWVGLAACPNKDQPMLVYVDNATAAGNLRYTSFSYGDF